MLDLLTTDDMETECSYKMEKEPKQGWRWKKEEIFFFFNIKQEIEEGIKL